jgi:hypothetical protein
MGTFYLQPHDESPPPAVCFRILEGYSPAPGLGNRKMSLALRGPSQGALYLQCLGVGQPTST